MTVVENDSSRPEFWNERYLGNRTPWEMPQAPAGLRRFLAGAPGGGRVLIPGCGRGEELSAFSRAGWDAVAIDFSPVAVAEAQEQVGPLLAERIVLGDFFAHPFAIGSFDAVYERTFWCALPPARWPEIAARYRQLLKPDGQLVGLFYFGDKDDGPPFGFAPGEEAQWLSHDFERTADEPVQDSLPLFAGRERWQQWRRR